MLANLSLLTKKEAQQGVLRAGTQVNFRKEHFGNLACKAAGANSSPASLAREGVLGAEALQHHWAILMSPIFGHVGRGKPFSSSTRLELCPKFARLLKREVEAVMDQVGVLKGQESTAGGGIALLDVVIQVEKLGKEQSCL